MRADQDQAQQNVSAHAKFMSTLKHEEAEAAKKITADHMHACDRDKSLGEIFPSIQASPSYCENRQQMLNATSSESGSGIPGHSSPRAGCLVRAIPAILSLLNLCQILRQYVTSAPLFQHRNTRFRAFLSRVDEIARKMYFYSFNDGNEWYTYSCYRVQRTS